MSGIAWTFIAGGLFIVVAHFFKVMSNNELIIGQVTENMDLETFRVLNGIANGAATIGAVLLFAATALAIIYN